MMTSPRHPGRSRRLALVLAFVLLSAPLVVVSNLAQEDAFITARVARHIARGAGPQFNVAEPVLGTTTPGWAYLTAPLYLVPLPPGAHMAVTQIATTAFVVGAIALVLAGAGLRGWPAALVAGGVAGLPVMAHAARAGMETALLVFLAALFWRLATIDDPARRHRLFPARLALAFALPLIRLDASLIVAVLAIVTAIGWRDRTRAVREVVWLGLAAAAALVLVGGVSMWIYGQPLPQSMVAKSGLSYERATSLTFNDWLRRAVQIFALDYPWPTVLAPTGIRTWWAAIWLAAAAVFVVSRRTSAPVRALIACGVVHGLSYATLLALGRAEVFPWYAHVPAFLASAGVLAAAAANRGSVAALVALPIGAGIIALAGISTAGLVRDGAPDNGALRAVGEYLGTVGARTVMLEPIGYVGFYSDVPEVQDLAGLISPGIFEFRRRGESGWFYDAAEVLQPEYIVLRAGEVEANTGWNVGVLFASDAERSAWQARYPLDREIANGAARYAVYRRR